MRLKGVLNSLVTGAAPGTFCRAGAAGVSARLFWRKAVRTCHQSPVYVTRRTLCTDAAPGLFLTRPRGATQITRLVLNNTPTKMEHHKVCCQHTEPILVVSSQISFYLANFATCLKQSAFRAETYFIVKHISCGVETDGNSISLH